ncbi:MAG: hypothetical protein IJ646_06275 [Clostridia bacterium]|nr:hypothetical protein [Clostridia bacterium]
MKRILSAVLILLLLGGALAEGWDFSRQSLDELYAIRDLLNARIGELERSDGVQVYESGTYQVGSDLPAGDYVLVEYENAMFASVIIRESQAEDSNLLAHHLIDHQLVVRLEAGTWITFSEARAYPLDQAPVAEDGVTGEGGYLVGALLPAGWYDVRLTDFAPLSSYSIYDGILGTGAQLTKFEVLRDTARIVLSDGEYIELSGCWLSPAE